MGRARFLVVSIFSAWSVFVFAGSQSSSADSRSTLLMLTERSAPCTVEEELKIADYLRQKTQSFLDLVDPLGPESFEDRPEIDEESAALLELKIDNLKLSLKQMIETLKLIERSIQELPTQYGQTGPLLWLTVVKVISTEKGNARDLETLGFVESTWPSIIEVALPRLFSRILEPKMDELIRVLRREQIFPRSQ